MGWDGMSLDSKDRRRSRDAGQRLRNVVRSQGLRGLLTQDEFDWACLLAERFFEIANRFDGESDHRVGQASAPSDHPCHPVHCCACRDCADLGKPGDGRCIRCGKPDSAEAGDVCDGCDREMSIEAEAEYRATAHEGTT